LGMWAVICFINMRNRHGKGGGNVSCCGLRYMDSQVGGRICHVLSSLLTVTWSKTYRGHFYPPLPTPTSVFTGSCAGALREQQRNFACWAASRADAKTHMSGCHPAECHGLISMKCQHVALHHIVREPVLARDALLALPCGVLAVVMGHLCRNAATRRCIHMLGWMFNLSKLFCVIDF